MANNQYLPTLNFQPYVKPYVGLPLKEIAEASTDLRNQYDANLASANAIELAARQLKTLKNDDPTKQEKIKQIENSIGEVAKTGGRWEFKASKINELAKMFQGDEDLQAIVESYKNAEEERKLYNQLSAQGKAIRFKSPDNHSTIVRNPDGTVSRNIYTPSTEMRLEYRPKMESYFDGMREISSETRTKTLNEEVDAQGNIRSVDKLTMYNGISKSRIIEQAKKSIDNYLQSNEGNQQFRVYTELGYNGKILTPDEARNQILKEMISTGMEREGIDSKTVDVAGAVKQGRSNGSNGNNKDPFLNSATMPIALQKISSDYKSVSDVDKTIKKLDTSEDEIVNKMVKDFTQNYVKDTKLTPNLLETFRKYAKDAINGNSKYEAWSKLAANYSNDIVTIKKAKEVENQRLIDASNYAMDKDPISASKVLQIENELEKLNPVEDEYGEIYSPKEIYNLLNAEDGVRLVKDGFGTYSFEHRGDFAGDSNKWVKTHSIDKSVIKPILDLIDNNEETIKKYNNVKNSYIKDISAKSITRRAETIMPGRTKEEQNSNTDKVNKYFSEKSNLIKTAGNIVPTDIDGGEIESNKNLTSILKDVKADDVKIGTVGLDLYDPSGQKTWVMTLSVGNKTYEVKVPYDNYKVSSIDAVLEDWKQDGGNGAATYNALKLIETNKAKGVSLVPIDGTNAKLKYNVANGEFEGVIYNNILLNPNDSKLALENMFKERNNVR